MSIQKPLVIVAAILVFLALAAIILIGGQREEGVEEVVETPEAPGAGEAAPAAEEETPQPVPEEAEPVVLRVLSRHPGEILELAKREFLESDVAKKYNIVDIKFYVYPPTGWVSAIKKRGDFDVAWGGGPTLFDTLYLQGLLAPLTSPEALEAASQIPDFLAGAPMKRIGDGEIYWVAASIASFGFTINRDVLQEYDLPIPRSWADLGSPVYALPLVEEGRPIVSIADPTQSTSNTRMYEIILQAYGWEEGWRVLTTMAANSLVEGSSSAVRDNVILGRVAIGITIDFYGYTAMKTNPATEYIIPEGESIVNGDPIALLVTSQNPEAAQAFIAWVLTEGQKIWFDEEINRLPSNPAAFDLPEGREREDLRRAFETIIEAQSIEFNDTEALLIEEAMRQYFKAVLVDQESLLKEVWIAMLTLYFNGEIGDEELEALIYRLSSPLTYNDPLTGEYVEFTFEDAVRVTKTLLEDPRARDKYYSAWAQAARERYLELLAELKG